MNKKNYVSLSKFKKFVRGLNIDSAHEYRSLYDYGKIAKKLYPKKPHLYYKRPKIFTWLPINEAKKQVHKLGLKNIHEWTAHSKSKKRLKNIPTHPGKAYKGRGWIGMKDWLGTGLDSKNFPSYNELKKLIRKANIKSSSGYRNWCREQKKHSGRYTANMVPVKPEKYYSGKGWTTWGEFTGTGNIRNTIKNKKWKPYKTAKQLIRKVRPKIKGYSQFLVLSKKGKLPKGVPSDPARVYKNKGWEGWKVFLGYKSNYHGGWKRL